jgi:hypothetical protein
MNAAFGQRPAKNRRQWTDLKQEYSTARRSGHSQTIFLRVREGRCGGAFPATAFRVI